MNKPIKENPLVSIIVPVYNAVKYLENCIDSIICQTYKNIEIIIVNDGSKDDSWSVCRKLEKKDSRIKIVNKENGGAGSARNQGIQLAKGSFIQFVDSDDEIKNNMTELLISQIKDADTVICGYEYFRNKVKIGEQKSTAKTIIIDKNKEEFLEILTKYTFTPINKLYRRNITPFFDENQKFGEDFIFNIAYFKKCDTIVIIPETPYIYNVDTPGSLTKSNKDKYLDLFKIIYKELLKFNESKLKNCFGEDFIYNYIFEHLSSIMINAIIFEKQNRSFVHAFLREPFVDNILKKIDYKGKKFLNRIKIFLLKRRCVRTYTFLVKIRKSHYLKNFVN